MATAKLRNEDLLSLENHLESPRLGWPLEFALIDEFVAWRASLWVFEEGGGTRFAGVEATVVAAGFCA